VVAGVHLGAGLYVGSGLHVGEVLHVGAGVYLGAGLHLGEGLHVGEGRPVVDDLEFRRACDYSGPHRAVGSERITGLPGARTAARAAGAAGGGTHPAYPAFRPLSGIVIQVRQGTATPRLAPEPGSTKVSGSWGIVCE